MAHHQALAYWFDVTADLLRRPLAEFPYAQLACHLHQTFAVNAVIWEWRDNANEHGCAHFEGDPKRFSAAPPAEFHPSECAHPLLRYHASDSDSGSHSVGNISTPVTGQHRKGFPDHLLPFVTDRELSIPYWRRGDQHGAFVLMRTAKNFSPEDLDLAAHLQRLITGIQVQVAAQRHSNSLRPPFRVEKAGLTGAETVVLSLLAQGYTAQQIALRTDNSPRTVQKHLEHIYRKLGVTDRLRAAQAATELGITSN